MEIMYKYNEQVKSLFNVHYWKMEHRLVYIIIIMECTIIICLTGRIILNQISSIEL